MEKQASFADPFISYPYTCRFAEYTKHQDQRQISFVLRLSHTLSTTASEMLKLLCHLVGERTKLTSHLKDLERKFQSPEAHSKLSCVNIFCVTHVN